MLIIYKIKVCALIKLMQEICFPQSDFSYVIIFFELKMEICNGKYVTFILCLYLTIVEYKKQNFILVFKVLSINITLKIIFIYIVNYNLQNKLCSL